MDHEVNIDSIRALEEQIREHERTIVKLKRTRNSLLNVSKLPPELLGKIFRWNVIREDDFGGLNEGSHNFLLVCHHWFEVALHTPELWSFWGNSMAEWARRCFRSGTAPLDLVLSDPGNAKSYTYFDTAMHDILQDHATQDAIRCVHLAAKDSRLLNSIIAPLTSNHDGELRSNSIESFILQNRSGMPSDVSDFFARYRFPKLQCIRLYNCTISSWDHLTSRTSVLTTLELYFRHPSPTPTTSQLLPILTSNPALQRVKLSGCTIPADSGEPSSRVQLHHLKELQLDGYLRSVAGLLHQLDHPRNMENVSINFHDCDVTDISQIIGPYLRDHLQRRDRPQNGLDLHVLPRDQSSRIGIKLRVGDTHGANFAPHWARENTFFDIGILLKGVPHRGVLRSATLGLLAYAPLEEIVYVHTDSNPATMEDAHTRFPNLRALSFDVESLPSAFPDPDLIADGKMFPSLEHVSLDYVGDGDLRPLVTFLAYRASSGNRLSTFEITGYSHICPEVLDYIEGMVGKLKVDQFHPRLICPFGTCQNS